MSVVAKPRERRTITQPQTDSEIGRGRHASRKEVDQRNAGQGKNGHEEVHVASSAGRRKYPTDLSDEQWRRVERVLRRKDDTGLQDDTGMPAQGPPSRRGRKRVTNLRDVVDALNYRWSTGCTWRMLPHDFPAWATVYFYFRQWRNDGRLAALRTLLMERPTVLETIRMEREELQCQAEGQGSIKNGGIRSGAA